MSGTIGAGAPWTRRSLKQFAANHPDELAAIEARIPDGTAVTLICGSRPMPLGAVMRNATGEVARVEPTYYNVGFACEAVLRKAEVAA